MAENFVKLLLRNIFYLNIDTNNNDNTLIINKLLYPRCTLRLCYFLSKIIHNLRKMNLLNKYSKFTIDQSMKLVYYRCLTGILNKNNWIHNCTGITRNKSTSVYYIEKNQHPSIIQNGNYYKAFSCNRILSYCQDPNYSLDFRLSTIRSYSTTSIKSDRENNKSFSETTKLKNDVPSTSQFTSINNTQSNIPHGKDSYSRHQFSTNNGISQPGNSETITAAVKLNSDFDSRPTLPQRIVSSCPGNVRPYLQLLRLDRPIGNYALYNLVVYSFVYYNNW